MLRGITVVFAAGCFAVALAQWLSGDVLPAVLLALAGGGSLGVLYATRDR